MYGKVYNEGRVPECCHINADVGLKEYPIMEILLCDVYIYTCMYIGSLYISCTVHLTCVDVVYNCKHSTYVRMCVCTLYVFDVT